jgi:hypothetical protein
MTRTNLEIAGSARFFSSLLEALNGMLLFGLTIAILFVVIDMTWASTRPLRVDATIHRMCVVNS